MKTTSHQFQWHSYSRQFRVPLETAHGQWKQREGVVFRLEDSDGRIGFGEIAPIPWFGTETLDQAVQWCKGKKTTGVGTEKISPELPCCSFAVEAALKQLEGLKTDHRFELATLVPLKDPGKLDEKIEQGFTTFKIKIGVEGFRDERELLETHLAKLGSEHHLRLDANEGLSPASMLQWLEFLKDHEIEYLEQPLAKGREAEIASCAANYKTPIALDESVSNANSLKEFSDWNGPLIVKPSILGSFQGALPDFAVGSSVFETSFGYQLALDFLAEKQVSHMAIGFGSAHVLEEEGLFIHPQGPAVETSKVGIDDLENLWKEMISR